MRARGTRLRLAAGVDGEGWKPSLGITPAIEGKLSEAAVALRRAAELIEEARQLAEEGGDTDLRCSAALEELDGVLYEVEWQPPEDGT